MDQICAKPLGKFMQPECNYSAIKSCRQMYFASCAEDWGCEGCSTEEGNFNIFGGYCILRDESDLEMRVPLPNILFWISKSVRTVNKRIYYIHIIILSDYVILCYVSKNTYHTCISLHIIRLQHLHFLEVQPSRSNLARGDGTGTMTKTSSATKYFGWFGWKCAVKYRRFLGDSYPFYLEFWRSTIEKHFFEFSGGGNLPISPRPRTSSLFRGPFQNFTPRPAMLEECQGP